MVDPTTIKMMQMPYSGATSMFVRIMLTKKYALPYRVIDALADHFVSFVKEQRRMPVLWHQALLVFVQRYKHELTTDQKKRVKQFLISLQKRIQEHRLLAMFMMMDTGLPM